MEKVAISSEKLVAKMVQPDQFGRNTVSKGNYNDILILERVQHLSTKLILHDFVTPYHMKLQKLSLLPLM